MSYWIRLTPTYAVDVGTEDTAAFELALQNFMRGAQGVPGSVSSYEVEASEALTAGRLINIYDSTGPKARHATNAAVGKEAHGYVLVDYALGAQAVVYLGGIDTAVTGLTAGPVYLGVNGAVAATPPDPIGVVQIVGTALSATALHFQPSAPVVLAGTP